MTYEQVDVYVEREGAPGIPVPNVLVRVYDPDGKQLFTEGTTDVLGRAGFLLYSQEYSLRFYRFQTAISQPQRIVVLSDPMTPGTTENAFTVKAAVFEHPIAVDPRLSRASGFFRDATGAPRPQLDIHFIAQFRPVLLDGSLVMDERRTLKTDKNGFGCIDLIRCAEYLVTIEAYEDQTRKIRVPDSPSVNLPDLLFPVVGRIVQDDVALSVSEELVITPVVLDTAGVPLPGSARNDILWSISDPAVASMAVTADNLVLTGLTAGSVELTAVRRDTSIVRIPDTGIVGVPVAVVVS